MESKPPERRIAVVGAGIVGVSCAWQLQKRGFQVTLIDRLQPGDACSFGNAGVIATSSCIPLVMPGTWRNVPKWLLDPDGPLAIDLRDVPRLASWFLQAQRMATSDGVHAAAKALHRLHAPALTDHLDQATEAGCDHLLRRCEYLHVYRTTAAYRADRSGWQLRRDLGIPMREVGAQELQELEPALSEGYACGVLLDGHGAALDPGGLVKALASDFMSRQGRYIQAEVGNIRPGDPRGVSVMAGGEELQFDTLVLAAGAWSAQLAKVIGHDFPLVAERGYHVMFREPGVSLNRPVMFAESKFVANSMNAGLRVAGTAEFAGIKRPAKAKRIEMLKRLASECLSGLNPGQQTSWMGPRPSLPDTLPVIGRSHLHPDVLLAFGHGHTGLTASATTGRIIAALAADESPEIDISAFRPERFPAKSSGPTPGKFRTGQKASETVG
ncbi:NAD(P)/FAD-dependent oxidoreductase [Fodinicurvata sediminis]|uniref:NAD(P)/FAD-dependent oxidoreductase n=1 Tax=Fodinicurvata sediminis TaxID=1121832 RepID=UPI0003B701D0|nr:FAD-binding oxidoreductase [Fodinicurvata sediminis]